MIERQYIFRRKLQMIALGLGAIATLICWARKAHAHVDLVHPDLDFIIREMIEEMHERENEAAREIAGYYYYPGDRDYQKSYEPDNEPGVKHD